MPPKLTTPSTTSPSSSQLDQYLCNTPSDSVLEAEASRMVVDYLTGLPEKLGGYLTDLKKQLGVSAITNPEREYHLPNLIQQDQEYQAKMREFQHEVPKGSDLWKAFDHVVDYKTPLTEERTSMEEKASSGSEDTTCQQSTTMLDTFFCLAKEQYDEIGRERDSSTVRSLEQLASPAIQAQLVADMATRSSSFHSSPLAGWLSSPKEPSQQAREAKEKMEIAMCQVMHPDNKHLHGSADPYLRRNQHGLTENCGGRPVAVGPQTTAFLNRVETFFHPAPTDVIGGQSVSLEHATLPVDLGMAMSAGTMLNAMPSTTWLTLPPPLSTSTTDSSSSQLSTLFSLPPELSIAMHAGTTLNAIPQSCSAYNSLFSVAPVSGIDSRSSSNCNVNSLDTALSFGSN